MLTTRRTGENFTGFEAQFDGCTVVLEPLTKNTYVLMVSIDSRIGGYLCCAGLEP